MDFFERSIRRFRTIMYLLAVCSIFVYDMGIVLPIILVGMDLFFLYVIFNPHALGLWIYPVDEVRS